MAFPSPAKDYEEERISLDREFIRHPNSTFFMRMDGYSMLNAFIAPGSLLVVDRAVKPNNMDVVIARLNGELRGLNLILFTIVRSLCGVAAVMLILMSI